jgi:hypothetical protein
MDSTLPTATTATRFPSFPMRGSRDIVIDPVNVLSGSESPAVFLPPNLLKSAVTHSTLFHYVRYRSTICHKACKMHRRLRMQCHGPRPDARDALR